jgi:lysophospholipase L1-like esterase
LRGAFAIAIMLLEVGMRRSALLRQDIARRGWRRASALAVAVALATCQLAVAGTAGAATAGPGTASAAAQPAPCPAVPGQPTGGSPRIMIVGDSITQGSSGDYTWQYRLYEHLRADGVSPQMVGPYNWLFNNVTNVQGDCSYANPRFERASDALWGTTLFAEKNAIRAKVARYRPGYLLVLLGLDDIFWYGISQPDMAANLKGFIAAARAAKPRIRIVLGLIPPDIHQQTEPAFAASIATFNKTISSTAARLSTTASPVAVAHDGTGINVAADLWDGTHPNANGEVRIAAGFADALASRFHLGRAYPTPFPVLPTGPLTSPGLTVTPSSTAGQVALSWTLAPGANGYYVYLRDVTMNQTTFTKLPWPLSPTGSPWTASLLSSGDTYAFKLQACKGSDCGAFSNVATVTAP